MNMHGNSYQLQIGVTKYRKRYIKLNCHYSLMTLCFSSSAKQYSQNKVLLFFFFEGQSETKKGVWCRDFFPENFNIVCFFNIKLVFSAKILPIYYIKNWKKIQDCLQCL